jgi:hypothetical protein
VLNIALPVIYTIFALYYRQETWIAKKEVTGSETDLFVGLIFGNVFMIGISGA